MDSKVSESEKAKRERRDAERERGDAEAASEDAQRERRKAERERGDTEPERGEAEPENRDAEDARQARAARRRLTTEIKESLREVSIQLDQLNHQVVTHLDLNDADLHCLELISRHGPLGPGGLARLAGLHPATVTGILDRLERGGWVARERDASDRRAVMVRPLRGRNAEVLRLFAGMNHLMDGICAGYTEAELSLIADFLRRTSGAGQTATTDLAGGPPS
jgi:DNA-binding MarR family transcriptional regulator